jgi:tetratricopeptide (TPR) repeat protein
MQEELKHLERIERYWEGRMTQEERLDFEIALLVDPVLQRESDIYKGVVQALKDIKTENVRNRLKAIDTELDRKGRSPGRTSSFPFQRVLLAALVVLAIGSTLFLLQGRTSSTSINPDFLPVEEGLPVLMSTSGEKSFDDAMSLFKAGEFRESADRFIPLLESRPVNDTLLFYTGNALLRSGRAADALPLFNRLTISHSPAYALKAGVYVALCSWETGAKQEALNQLREISFLENHPYKNEAMALFNQLKSTR